MRAITMTLAVLFAAAASPLAAQTASDSSTFIKAVREGDYRTAVALLGTPGSTVAKSRDSASGDTALHITIRDRDAGWTDLMLSKGVDPNASNRTGETPLGLASRLGFEEGARLLIGGGARVDGSNNSGQTPLIIAVQNMQMAPGARIQLVQMLVRQGASPDKTDNVGLSARDYARQDRRSAAVLRALEEKRPPARAPAGPSRPSPQ